MALRPCKSAHASVNGRLTLWSPNQYSYCLKKWNIRKNVSGKTRKAISDVVNQRRVAGKRSHVMMEGSIVSAAQQARYKRRMLTNLEVAPQCTL
jgi:hypothetical protein